MAEIAERADAPLVSRPSLFGELFRKEDWWAIWIGLGLVAVAVALFTGGSSIKWIAVAPQKWSHLPDAWGQIQANGVRFGALFVLWSFAFGLGAAALGIRLSRFLPAFLVLFVVAGLIYFLGLWDQSARYNLEPPLVALALGLLVSNTVGTPAWLDSALRVEFYIKTGIVLLGASLPLTLIAWAGPTAILQAAIVSLVTFGTIYFAGTRLGLDRRLAATLGTGGAVCGVSGAIAVGGAVGAKKEQVFGRDLAGGAVGHRHDLRAAAGGARARAAHWRRRRVDRHLGVRRRGGSRSRADLRGLCRQRARHHRQSRTRPSPPSRS